MQVDYEVKSIMALSLLRLDDNKIVDMEVRFLEMGMIQFTEDDSLTKINKVVKQELHGKDFWGQIDVSKDDLNIIKNRIELLIDRGVEFKQLFKDYPYAMVTYVVFLTKYQYNGDFWGMISEEIGIDKPNGSDQAMIGKKNSAYI